MKRTIAIFAFGILLLTVQNSFAGDGLTATEKMELKEIKRIERVETKETNKQHRNANEIEFERVAEKRFLESNIIESEMKIEIKQARVNRLEKVGNITVDGQKSIDRLNRGIERHSLIIEDLTRLVNQL